METTKKFCKKCNTLLELNYFHKSKSKSYIDGHIATCKVCIKNRIVKPKEDKEFSIEKGVFVFSFE